MTIRLGAVTTMPNVRSSWSALVEQVDKELHRAKSAGRYDESALCFLMRYTSREMGRNIGNRVFENIATGSLVFADAYLMLETANGFVYFYPQSDDRHVNELIEDGRTEVARNNGRDKNLNRAQASRLFSRWLCGDRLFRGLAIAERFLKAGVADKSFYGV